VGTSCTAEWVAVYRRPLVTGKESGCCANGWSREQALLWCSTTFSPGKLDAEENARSWPLKSLSEAEG
jgi:hypothetical protein